MSARKVQLQKVVVSHRLSLLLKSTISYFSTRGALCFGYQLADQGGSEVPAAGGRVEPI